MKTLILSLLCIFLSTTIIAQSSYNDAIVRGDKAFHRGNFGDAINYYFAAEAFDPSKKKEVKQKINRVFGKIEQQKKDAERATAAAKKAKIEIEKQKQQIEVERNKAIAAKELAELQKRQADTLSQANLIVAQALDIKDKNPTLAMHLANYAYQYSNHKDFLSTKIRREIFQNGNLGRIQHTIEFKNTLSPSIDFSSDGNQFLCVVRNEYALLMNCSGKKEVSFHDKSINKAKFSNDGTLVITSSNIRSKGRISFWDLKGNRLKYFEIGQTKINDFEISPDGQSILIINSSKNSKKDAQLWDLDGNLLMTFKRHLQTIEDIAFSPDGQKILTASNDSTAILWSTKTGKPIYIFKDHHGPVISLDFSPNGKEIITAGFYEIFKWNLDGEQTKTIQNINQKINCVKYLPDGEHILIGGYQGSLRLINIHIPLEANFKGHHRTVKEIDFSSQGRAISIESNNNKIIIWDIHPIQTETIHPFFNLNRNKINLFSPNGKHLFTSSNLAGTILDSLFNTITSFKFEHELEEAIFSPNNKYLLTRSVTRRSINEVLLWTTNGQLIRKLNVPKKVTRNMAFSPNSQYILTGHNDSLAILWNIDGQIIKKLPQPDSETRHVAFSSDNSYIITATTKIAILWNFNGNKLHSSSIKNNEISSISFSPDNKKYILGTRNQAIIFDINGKNLSTLEHDDKIRVASFSPNGKYILTSSFKKAYLWNAHGVFLDSLSINKNILHRAFFLSDSKHFILGASNNYIDLYDLKFNLIQRIKLQTNSPFHLSPNTQEIKYVQNHMLERTKLITNYYSKLSNSYFTFDQSNTYSIPTDYKNIKQLSYTYGAYIAELKKGIYFHYSFSNLNRSEYNSLNRLMSMERKGVFSHPQNLKKDIPLSKLEKSTASLLNALDIIEYLVFKRNGTTYYEDLADVYYQLAVNYSYGDLGKSKMYLNKSKDIHQKLFNNGVSKEWNQKQLDKITKAEIHWELIKSSSGANHK